MRFKTSSTQTGFFLTLLYEFLIMPKYSLIFAAENLTFIFIAFILNVVGKITKKLGPNYKGTIENIVKAPY